MSRPGRAPSRSGSARSSAPGRAERGRPPPLRRLAVDFAHLWVFSAFALAQPLFDLLGENADFFAVRGSTRWEIVLFALAVVFVPPLGLLAIEVVAGLVSESLRRVVHAVFLTGLAGVVFLQVLKRSTDLSSTTALLVLAGVLGAAVTALDLRVRAFRSFVTVLTPAPLVFLAMFLAASPVSKLAFASSPEVELADVGARAPVVLLVFDELPVTSLMRRDGEVDAERFPSFARLARDSTWFRNATTVSGSTTRAVPAILTGNLPEGRKPPVFAEHPRNLFTLLGGDYRLNVVETATRLCPPAVCNGRIRVETPETEPVSLYSDVGIVYLHLLAPPRLAEGLPPITNQWMNFGRESDEAEEFLDKALAAARAEPDAAGAAHAGPAGNARFYDARARGVRRFIRSVAPRARPSLDFMHVWFPHGPWAYFPSGSQSAIGWEPVPGNDGEDYWQEPFLTTQANQRHLLQVGFVDRLLGLLLDRLQRTGLYRDAVLVVTADHGVSFRPGERRRTASRKTAQDIVFVPLFVKAPGQERGEVVDYHVQTTDIVPTIADILGVELPWPVDGRSALRDPGHERLEFVTARGDSKDFGMPFERLVARRDRALARQVRLFGDGGWGRLFVVEPHRGLLGASLSEVEIGAAALDRAALDDEATRRLLGALSRERPFVPSPLTGYVEGSGARSGRALAVAVNGTIAAIAETYERGGTVKFSALAPESAFQTGANEVAFFWVDGAAGAETLTPLQNG